MGLFTCRSCEAYRHQISVLLAQLSDRDELMLKLVEQHATERAEILEQLLAVTRPGAVTEIRRDPNTRRDHTLQPPPRPNFPGFRRDLRPPVPPGQSLNAGREPASDSEAVQAIAKAIQNQVAES